MAEEPQPSNVQEGADAPDVVPASKEDRKAAAALSSLDVKEDQDATPNKKEVDLKALGEAMKNLEVGQSTQTKSAAVKKEEAPKKPLIKVATYLDEESGVEVYQEVTGARFHTAFCNL